MCGDGKKVGTELQTRHPDSGGEGSQESGGPWTKQTRQEGLTTEKHSAAFMKWGQ